MLPIPRVLFFVLASLGIVIAWQFAAVPTYRIVAMQEEDWALPSPARPGPLKAIEILSKTSPWGRLPETVEEAPLNPPDWRILGIVTRGQERVVVIKVGNLPEQRLTVGEALPGGATILGINDESLCLLVDGKKRKLDMYQRGSVI